MNKDKKITCIINYILKDFSQTFDKNDFKTNDVNKYLNISISNKIEPHYIFLIFSELLSYKFIGRSEKVQWELPLKYKNNYFLFVHGKFGFSIYGSNLSSDSEFEVNLATEALITLKKIIRFLPHILENKIIEKVDAGSIAVMNYYNRLYSRYMYFKNESSKYFKNFENLQIEKKEYIKVLISKESEDYYKAEYNFIAMLDSFYSLVEHFLVLILPFTDSIENIDSISNFINCTWGNKYSYILDQLNNSQFNNFKIKLRKIKEDFRNRYSHGLMEKGEKSIFINWDNIGFIPANLDKSISYCDIFFDSITVPEFTNTYKTFDEFIELLENDEYTKYGMKYIQSNLPIRFDKETIQECKLAMTSDESFDNLIEKHGYLFDQSMNMDW